MTPFRIVIDNTEYTEQDLITPADIYSLIELQANYKADFDFVKNLADYLSGRLDTFTKAGKPLHQRANYYAFVKVQTCISVLKAAVENVTRQFIIDVESYFMENYDVKFTSLLESDSVGLDRFFYNYHSIMAAIIKQTGPNLIQAGSSNALSHLATAIKKLRVKPTVLRYKVRLPELVTFKKGASPVLGVDSAAIMRRLIAVLSAHVGGSAGLTHQDKETIDKWSSLPVSFGTQYRILDRYYVDFCASGRVDISCPDPENAMAIHAVITGGK